MEAPATFAQLKLQFGHDCRNWGCNTVGCGLCKNNPKRRCQTHFREKYVDNANRVFTAWCTAPILVRLVDTVTGDEYDRTMDNLNRLDNIDLQLCLLEGLMYDTKVSEVGSDNITEEDLERMLLLDNTNSNAPEPLLVPGKGAVGEHTVDHKLNVPLVAEGTPILVRTSRSSQSAQGGRTRPFRMLARAVNRESGAYVLDVLLDISEPFVVTTRRTQGAEKALVPVWNDPVNKLPGVGKETYSKLKDLAHAGFTYPLRNYKILTVGQLFELVDKADNDLLEALGKVLGLKPEKVTELQQNARTVAREDYRKRVWGNPDYPADRLLYPCEAGAPCLLSEHIEVMRDTEDGVEITSTMDLPAEDLTRVLTMRQLAFESWWAPLHPGWGIIEEAEVNTGNEALDTMPVPETTPLVSLRQQMDRACKQRRFNPKGSYSNQGSHDDWSDSHRSGSLRSIEVVSQPSHSVPQSSFDFPSVAQDCMQAPESVFSDSGEIQLDPLAIAAQEMRETNPNADRFQNAASSQVLLQNPMGLLQEPAGLAVIIQGPQNERSGIRFKRSVSGQRWKPPVESASYHAMGTVYSGGAMNYETMPAPAQVKSLHNSTPPSGFFAGLPPRPSRELRSQTSLDRVANWQQSRLAPSTSFDKRLSFDFLHSWLTERDLNQEALQQAAHELGLGSDILPYDRA